MSYDRLQAYCNAKNIKQSPPHSDHYIVCTTHLITFWFPGVTLYMYLFKIIFVYVKMQISNGRCTRLITLNIYFYGRSSSDKNASSHV